MIQGGIMAHTNNDEDIQVLSSQVHDNYEPKKITDNDDDKDAKTKTQQFINQILDAENLLVLAGSGTSLTFNSSTPKVAPSMGDLWKACEALSNFQDVLKSVKYSVVAGTWDDESEKKDIELLLSLCDAYLPLNNLSNQRQNRVRNFLNEAKKTILQKTNFVDQVPLESWDAHNNFIRTLGRRSPKQQRLKLFTTNYDLAFEKAASNTGMIVIDGFEFSNPANFNPAWFQYDIVNRTQNNAYLSNVFQLYKLHGSVDWNKSSSIVQKINIQNGSLPLNPVFIYPSSSKYQISYDSPYLDMISAFLESVQKPKTALICIGFGFNDKHLNNAITMALRTNPELMLLIVTMDPFNSKGSFSADIREKLTRAITAGDSRIMIIDSKFDNFSLKMLPNRHTQSPEEKLLASFSQILEGSI